MNGADTMLLGLNIRDIGGVDTIKHWTSSVESDAMLFILRPIFPFTYFHSQIIQTLITFFKII